MSTLSNRQAAAAGMIAAIGVVCGAAVMAGIGSATRPEAAPAPAVVAAPPQGPMIAVIDLETAVQGLNERADREAALKAKLDELQTKVTGMEEQVKADKAKLEVMPAGPAKVTAGMALRDLMIRSEFERNYAQRLLNEMEANTLREMYLKIDAAAERLATANGYHLVLASDENVQIPEGETAEVMRAIALKRMMYVETSLNVTAELVTMMNNEYAAAAGKR